jgi:RNA polymerase sigma-70 factor (ECF subfamily)
MSPEPRPGELAFLSTLALLGRASGGDDKARGALYDRYLPRLRRWAKGRIPRKARGLVDTDDVVESTGLISASPTAASTKAGRLWAPMVSSSTSECS